MANWCGNVVFLATGHLCTFSDLSRGLTRVARAFARTLDDLARPTGPDRDGDGSDHG